MNPFVLDVIAVAIGAHASAINAGSDHGNASGFMAEVEHTLSPHVALRGEVAFDSITMHSDEQPFAFDGSQVVVLGGVRFDLMPRDERRVVRPFAASELGVAVMHVDHHPMVTTVDSTRFVPLAAGLDLSLGDHDLVRVEVAAMLYSTYEDVLALTAGAAYAHSF